MNLTKNCKQYCLVFFLLFCHGCATPNPELWPPPAGTPTKAIYVSLDTWHAMVGFSRDTLENEQGLTSRIQPTTPSSLKQAFEEWGYAERAWYLEEQQGISGTIRAMLWPTEGVVEVAQNDQVWAERTPQPPADLFTFHINQKRFLRLRTHLRSTIKSSDILLTVRNSRFYRANRAYHLFYHCHYYVARALKEAGLPISIFWAISRTTLANQLHRAETFVKQRQDE